MIKPLRVFTGIMPVLAMLTVVGWYLYAPALQAPFVFDDLPEILENPHIRVTGFAPDIPKRLLICSKFNRLLAYATFAVNYYFHQYDVRGYRLVNVGLHVLTACLLFMLARLTFGLCGAPDIRLPFLTAALWLVSPVHTQSVTYIVQRMNTLAAMFVLLALCCYVFARRSQVNGKTGLKSILLFTGTALSGLCGLASKQTAAILPVILLLYEWFFFQNLDRAWLKKKLGWISLVLVVLMAISLVYMGRHPVEKLLHMYQTQDFTPGQRLLTEPRVILYYLTLLLFPHPARLNLDYSFPLSLSLVNPATTLPAILSLSALAAAAVYTAGKHRLLSFSILWFMVTLAIESSFIGLALIFEHRTYLPSVFPAMAITYFLARQIKPAPVGILAILVVIGLCGYGTYQRNRVWNNALVFWQDNVRKSPDKPGPNNNLGLVYKEIGAFDKALFFSNKALALKKEKFGANHPEVAESLGNIGLIYYRQGEYDQALEYHFKALAIQESVSAGQNQQQLFEIYSNIGIAYDGKGDFNKAVGYYQRALEIEKKFSSAENLHTASIYNNLGSAWYNKGDYEKAIANYEKSLAIRKKLLGRQHQQIAECYNNMGLAYGGRGDYGAAIDCYQQALEIELAVLGVDHYYTAATYFNLGLTCYARGDYRNAVFYMRKVLTLYSTTLGRHHSYIETAQSILNEVFLSGAEGFKKTDKPLNP